MKLSEYIQLLQEIHKKHGDNLKLIYSRDDEGNSFSPINFDPSAGNYDEEEKDFTSEDSKDFDGEINSVCVN